MHNQEWGGLPSEPLTPHSPADNLEPLPTIDAVSLTDPENAGVTSVNIEMPAIAADEGQEMGDEK